MMVLHVDPDKKTNLLVSFPRDLLVTDPATGRKVQINGLFNNGPQPVIDMLNKDFGVEVHHFVQIDFQAFIGVVEAVGKIPVYFPYPARDQYSGLNIPYAGCQPLDGNAALAYVRSRHLEYEKNGRWTDASPRADLDRITRQQDFIRKLASYASAKAGQNPLDALDIANAIVPKLHVDAQLSKDNILRLVKTFRNVDPKQPGALEMVTLPNVASTAQPGRLDVQQPEADQLLARLRAFGGDPAKTPTVREADTVVSVLNGSDKPGEAGKTIAKLQLRGFGPGAVGNAPAAAKTLDALRPERPGQGRARRPLPRWRRPADRGPDGERRRRRARHRQRLARRPRQGQDRRRTVDDVDHGRQGLGQDLQHHGEGPAGRRCRSARLLRRRILHP